MSGGQAKAFVWGNSSAAGAWPQDKTRLTNRGQRLKTIENNKLEQVMVIGGRERVQGD
jgi:hypothetical protein